MSPILLTDCKSQVPSTPSSASMSVPGTRRAQKHVAHRSLACCEKVCLRVRPMEEIGVRGGGCRPCVPSADTSPPVSPHVTSSDALRTGPLGVWGGFMPQAGLVDSLPISWVGYPGNPSPASAFPRQPHPQKRQFYYSLLGNCRGFGTCEPRIVDKY